MHLWETKRKRATAVVIAVLAAIVVTVCVYYTVMGTVGKGAQSKHPVDRDEAIRIAGNFLVQVGLGDYVTTDVEFMPWEEGAFALTFKKAKGYSVVGLLRRNPNIVLGVHLPFPDHWYPSHPCTTEAEALKTAIDFLGKAKCKVTGPPDPEYSSFREVQRELNGMTKELLQHEFVWVTRAYSIPVCNHMCRISVCPATGVVDSYRRDAPISENDLPAPPFRVGREKAIRAARTAFPELGEKFEIYLCYMTPYGGLPPSPENPIKPYWIGRKERVAHRMPSITSREKYCINYIRGIVRVDAQTSAVDEDWGGDQTHFAIAKRLALEREKGK
ncbi:MAG TPA: hypothetical protein PL033_09945 [Candidatus Brocadiia bacterium]|nr:hypothetical protein [Candidatus Brocadiia bacterium]